MITEMNPQEPKRCDVCGSEKCCPAVGYPHDEECNLLCHGHPEGRKECKCPYTPHDCHAEHDCCPKPEAPRCLTCNDTGLTTAIGGANPVPCRVCQPPTQEAWEERFDKMKFDLRKVEIGDDHNCEAWTGLDPDEEGNAYHALNAGVLGKDAPVIKAFVRQEKAASREEGYKDGYEQGKIDGGLDGCPNCKPR